jgi:hypothetical protein
MNSGFYQNEYPAPTAIATDPFHVTDALERCKQSIYEYMCAHQSARAGETHPCQQASKSTSQGGSAEEQCYPVMLLVPLVPHGKIKHHSGEEAALSDTKKEPRNKVSGVVLDDAQESGHDGGGESNSREPEARTCPPENNVAWDLKQDVANAPQCQAGQILISSCVYRYAKSVY